MTDEELLAQAQLALHNLLIGQSARVFVDQNGERVEYTSANAARLRAYIQELNEKINSSDLGSRGPLRPVF